MAIARPRAKQISQKAKPRSQSPVLLHNISQLVTMRSDSLGPRRGRQMREIGLLTDAAVLISGGAIVAVGTTREVSREPWIRQHRSEIIDLDCRGKVVFPGFVDAHTHPVFTGPRLIDFEKRIEGATYEQIAEAGGGIRSSINGVRQGKDTELIAGVTSLLRQATAQGTTTVEAKSGYGLDFDSEMRSLSAIRRAAEEWPGTVVSTFLGAHVVPPEFRSKPERYVDLVCKQMIPEVAKRRLAVFVDVFCERGAFTLQQSVRILQTAAKYGLQTRAHVGQLTRTDLADLLSCAPTSLDHLDHLSAADIRVLAQSDTVATLVPGANYFLATDAYPPARKLIDAGVPVALATDYNPGTSPTSSMAMILSLACTQMRMSPEEAVTGATINGAQSLRLAHRKGSVESGKDADLAFFELDDYRELPYWFGTNHCVGTMIGGHFAELY